MRRALFFWTIAFLGGLLLARFTAAPWMLYVLLGVGSAALFLLLFLSDQPLWLCLLACMLTLGCLYGDWRESLRPVCALAADTEYTLEGVVTAVGGTDGDRQHFDFRVERADGVAIDKPYNVRVTAAAGEDIVYGAALRLWGNTFDSGCPTNPGQFDYTAYLRNQNILACFSTYYGGTVESLGENRGFWPVRWACQLRGRFEAALDFLPESQRSLVAGIFFGDKSGLADATRTDLIRGGLMHAFAVSGLHVGYVILFLTALCGLFRIYNRWRLALIATALFFYCAMTGFVPSVMRAAIMGVLLLAAFNLGRERDGLTALAAAALLLCLIDPQVLAQAGFQLSFAAMFGILWFGPFLDRLMPRKFPLRGGVLVMLAAQIGVTPLLVYYFHLVSFASLLISVVGCLLVGGVVILALCAMLPSLFWPAAGATLLYGAGFLAEAVRLMTELGVLLPGAYRYIGTVTVWQVALTYGILVALPLIPRLRLQRWLGATALIAVLIVFLLPWPAPGQRLLTVTVLDVGSGNCVVIRGPDGATTLVDAGGDRDDTAAYVIAPYLTAQGVDKLTAILRSHGDSDHSNGLNYLLSYFPCEQLWLSQRDEAEPELTTLCDQRGVELVAAAPGETLALGHGAELTVLAPAPEDVTTDDNELSLVVRLTYGDVSFLFPGDIGAAGTDNLLRHPNQVDCTVLELPHHGAATSFSPYLYRRTSPQYVVVSVGENNYGHPDEEVLRYFAARDVAVLRTDEQGAISFTTDGQTLSVETCMEEEKTGTNNAQSTS